MSKSICLELPLGYRRAEKAFHFKVSDAEKILTTKKQRYYTKAVRRNDNAVLYSSYLVCPYCNKHHVANTKYSFLGHRTGFCNERISKNAIHNWSALQLSFFNDSADDEIEISSAISKPVSLKCPECGMVSAFSDNCRKVIINKEDKKIYVKSEVLCLDEVLNSNLSGNCAISVTFPMYEALCFDFENGNVFVKLENDNGVVLFQKDITSIPQVLEGGAVHKVLTYNKIARREIKRMFQQMWGTELPYPEKDLNIENLFKMTMFIGYNKDFYSEIPFEFDYLSVDKSFSSQIKELHIAKNAISLFSKSSLPQIKSVKKIFYVNQGLFFYLSEAEQIWSVISDSNLFCTILKQPNIFELLSDLHMRPGIIEYIRDYCFVKGAISFIGVVNENWYSVREAAIDYCGMSPETKKYVQESWRSEHGIGRIVRRKSLYSVPLYKIDSEIKDCTVNGYDFFWLRNNHEYVNAGKKLHNCLGSWGCYNWPVVCVKKQGQYVAAIEIANSRIMQVKGINNSDIQPDSELYNALEKWKARYNLDDTWYDDDDPYAQNFLMI